MGRDTEESQKKELQKYRLQMLRWLISFASIDLERLNKKARKRLENQVAEFIWWPMPRQTKDPPPLLETLQNDLEGGLESLAHGEAWIVSRVNIAIEAKNGNEIIKGYSALKGRDVTPVFLAKAQELVTERWPNVHWCAECGRLFVGIPNQRYCNPGHGNRYRRMKSYYNPERLRREL